MRLIPLAQFYLLKLMTRLAPAGDDRPVLAACQQLIRLTSESGFVLFKTEQFRGLVRFETLPEVEQDRIFNELEVAGILLALFCLEHVDAFIERIDFHFWRKVHEALPGRFERHLCELGVAESNAALTRKLIAMRREEYQELIDETWQFWKEEEPAFRELPHDTARHSAARTHALAIGTADHILRGKLKPGGDLPRLLRSWLLVLNEEVGRFVLKL